MKKTEKVKRTIKPHATYQAVQEVINTPIPLPPEINLPFGVEPGVSIIKAETSVEWKLNNDLTKITILSRARSFRGQTPAELHFEEAERQFMKIIGDSHLMRVKGVAIINNQWEVDQWEFQKKKFIEEGKPINEKWCALECDNEEKFKTILEAGYQVTGLGLGTQTPELIMKSDDRNEIKPNGETIRTILLLKVIIGKVTRLKGKNMMDGFDSYEEDNRVSVFRSSQALPVYVVKSTSPK